MQKMKFWFRIALSVVVGAFFSINGLLWLLRAFSMTIELGCVQEDCLPFAQTWWKLGLAVLTMFLGMAFVKGAWDKWKQQASIEFEE